MNNNKFDTPEAKVFFMAKDIQEKDELIKELVASIDITTRLLRADRLTGVDSRESIEKDLIEVLKKAKDMGY